MSSVIHIGRLQEQYWLHAGLSHAFLQGFWRFIWSARISRRIMYFMWMLVHGGLAVGWPGWNMIPLVCVAQIRLRSALVIVFGCVLMLR